MAAKLKAGRLFSIVIAGIVMCAAGSGARANPLPRPEFLTAADVTRILQQTVVAARARSAAATVAVVDRVGNVLAVYRMFNSRSTAIVSAGRPVKPPRGLVGLSLPADAVAIAKAITGAYLSSNGNAFTTRTASQIIQENYNPLSSGLEGGPLFGVQLSQLPCSDLSVRFASNNGGVIDPTIGPKRSPLGFSADPGGLPLYKNGVLVGGVGVISDGIYGLVRNKDADGGNDELFALSATTGFGPPDQIKANRVVVDGRTLTFSNTSAIGSDQLAGSDGVVLEDVGMFVPVTGYYDGPGALAGQPFGFGQSGILPDPDGIFQNSQAYVLTDAAGVNRFPPIAGSDMTAAEVTQILKSALGVALQARAQIRQPLGSFVEVTISVTDKDGTILGLVRTPDAPVFGTDVSLQKARTAIFFSSPAAFNILPTLPTPVNPVLGQLGLAPGVYFIRMQKFLGQRLAGWWAFTETSLGNLARPFYPDGRNGRRNGPLSKPFASWSPFNTGLQLDLIVGGLVDHLFFVQTGSTDTAAGCAPHLGNGLQIFAGSVPIFRNNTPVGGIGVSGDGIDQDSMIAFLGVDRAGRGLKTGIHNAPKSRRADRLSPDGANLRYVQCPFKPFNGSNEQSVCNGK